MGDGLERLVAFADAHPDAAVVGPRLRNPDGSLQRSVRGDPTLWRLATEYLFLRKLAPRSRPLNAFYGGGFDHDAVREVESLQGAALLVRREATDAVGLFDEAFFMFSEETDWLLPLPRRGLEGAVLPGRRGRARRRRARTAGGSTSRTCAGILRFLASTAARGRPSARGGCCSWSLRLRLAARPRRARRAVPRRARASSPRATSRRSLAMIGEYLRLAFGTALVLLPGPARRAGARAAERLGDARLGARGALRRLVAVVFVVHGTIWLALGILALIGVAAADRGPPVAPHAAVRRASGRERRSLGARRASLAFGIVLGLLLWHVAGVVAGDGLFHLARVRKLVELGDLHLRTVDEFRRRRASPRLRVPALARLPRARREALRARPGGRR